jgi:hypothetical protein
MEKDNLSPDLENGAKCVLVLYIVVVTKKDVALDFLLDKTGCILQPR